MFTCYDVTVTDYGQSVTARFIIVPDGRLINSSAMRYRENKGIYTFDLRDTLMTEWGQPPSTRLAFCPPNPNELDNVARTGADRAALGT